MNDEILESVREGFVPVHMDRPLEAIEARGRAYRRKRMLTGLGGMSLAVGLGLALVLPSTDPAAHRDENVAQTVVSTTQPSQRMEYVSFTLTSAADGQVTITFKEAVADSKAVEKALADAGITAVVRVNEFCVPGNGADLGPEPQADNGAGKMPYSIAHLRGGDGDSPLAIVIDGARLPKTVTLNLSLSFSYGQLGRGRQVNPEIGHFPTGGVRGLQSLLSVKGSPVTCRPTFTSKATR